ncbi:MAG: hypothetical protein HQL39_01115 [Alphaproteobacteria bacterium]|nr:hypothetical protein [Alphaproteobacteria bacterium]
MRTAAIALLAALTLAGAALAADKKAKAVVIPDPYSRLAPEEGAFVPLDQIPNHRQLMRDIVDELSAYAKKRDGRFIVLVRNGWDLIAKGRREAVWEDLRFPSQAETRPPEGSPNRAFLRGIDGFVANGVFCDRANPAEKTADEPRAAMLAAAEVVRQAGRRMLDIEVCAKPLIDEAAREAGKARLLAHSRQDAAFDTVPNWPPPGENAAHIESLGAARNFLPLLDPRRYATRAEYVMALEDGNHDLLIVDPFHRGADNLTADEIYRLKFKRLGARRLVLAVLSVGKARDDRFYWRRGWDLGNPSFLATADPAEPGAMLVRYWEPGWKEILGRSLKGIVDLGFDGVLLDDLEVTRYFEALTPLE